MIHLPELITQIGLYLDSEYLFACTSVTRDWRALFLPCFWRVIDGREHTWRSFFLSIPTAELPGIFLEHQHWIRELVIDKVIVLNALVDADLAGLHSLSIIYPTPSPNKIRRLETLLSGELEELIPEATFISPDIGSGTQATILLWS